MSERVTAERDIVRDAFEEWAEADHRRLEPNEGEADDRTPSNNHYYEDDTTNQAYIGWCAAQPLIAEIERLQDRLEMRHAHQMIDGKMTRIEVEPGSIPDGIECRDETIRQQDASLKRQRAEVERLRAEALPTPDVAVMRGYIERLTRFFIDRPEWVVLADEARGYIGALASAPVDATEEQERSRRRASPSSLQPPKEGTT